MNELFDKLSDFLAERRGLLPLIGIALIVLNLLLHVVVGLLGTDIWLASSNLLLHIGLIVGIIGLLLIKPLQ